MSDTKQKYVIRFETENGQVVNTQMELMGATGEKSLKKIESAAVNVDSRLSILSQTVATRLLPLFSAGALISAFRSTTKELGDLKDAAEKVGLSAEKLQVFRLIGEDAGLDDGSVDAALSKFTKGVGEAQLGVGKLLDVLKYYNIELKNSDGTNRDSIAVLRDLADVVANTKDAQEQLFITQRAFGDDGAGFVNAMRNGSKGLEELEKRARETGKVFDDELVNKADEFDKAWDHTMRSWEVGWKSTLIRVVESFQKFSEQQNDLSKIQGNYAFDPTTGRPYSTDAKFSTKSEPYGPPTPSNLSTLLATPKRPSYKSLKDMKDAQTDAENAKKKIDDVIKSLQLKTENLSASNEKQEVYNELQKAGVDIDSKAGQQIKALVTQYEKLHDQYEKVEKAAKSLGDAVSSSFEDMIFNGKSANDVLASLESTIEKIFYQAFIGDDLQKAVTNFAKTTLPDLFGGFKAEGGPLEQGKWYIAGERGPEPVWGGGTGAFAIGYDQQKAAAVSSGSAGVSVTVINNTPSDVSVQQSRDGNGQNLKVMVDQAVAKNINSAGTDTNRALKQFTTKKPLISS